MLEIIISAIKNKQILSFSYDNINRVVEPHTVGRARTGNDLLRCYQIEGGHITSGHEWNLCNLEKIANLSVTGASFDSARPGYKKGDKAMTHIYAEL